MNDPMSQLRDRITADMKDAMRAKAAARLSTIRLLLAAIKQREVDERKTLSDADVVAVIDKMVKQRKDSITQFDAGNRADLADAERAELVILQSYLPAPLSDAEVDAAIDGAVAAARAGGRSGPGADRQGDGRAEAGARRSRRHGGGIRQGQGTRLTHAHRSESRAQRRPPFYTGAFPCRVGSARGRRQPVARCPESGSDTLPSFFGLASSVRPAGPQSRTR